MEYDEIEKTLKDFEGGTVAPNNLLVYLRKIFQQNKFKDEQAERQAKASQEAAKAAIKTQKNINVNTKQGVGTNQEAP